MSNYNKQRRLKLKTELNEIEINGVEYVKKSEVNKIAEKTDGMEYVIVRTCSAGVHAGYLKSRNGKEVELINSRRIWYWNGAASLSQLAMDGAKNQDKCKYPCVLPTIYITEAVEIIPCTDKARINIQETHTWKH